MHPPRYKQCEVEASSGRPASVPQLKCVCLNSPFEECDVQPSCPHLFIPVAFLHWHPRQRGSIILSHKVTSSQRHFEHLMLSKKKEKKKRRKCSHWLIISIYACHFCTGFRALTGSMLSLSAESILSTAASYHISWFSSLVICL